MPVVTIQQGPKTVEQKRELIKQITDAFVSAYDTSPESVWVFFHDVPTESWGAAGKLVADK
ncbi:MAG TPA: 4-oxalocrotonate tautomerase DmpI [Pseudonocardiaceae bacterium]|nr:4-oxalocrotonate tautomerase DmpI [Pseudonocardiaceae bacterium]